MVCGHASSNEPPLLRRNEPSASHLKNRLSQRATDKGTSSFRHAYSLGLAVFARAPVPGTTKTRLIPLLGAERAAELQAALTCDTLRKIDALRGRVMPYLFVAGRSAAFASWSDRRSRSRLVLASQQRANLGHRLEGAFRLLLARHAAAVVIGTDSPLLPVRVLAEAFRELRVCDAVLGPCPDGGYYLIGLRRLAAGMFHGVRWGSASAFRDTLQRILQRDFSCSILRPFADVDRPSDLRRLRKELALNRAARRLAPATWRFLRNQARHTVPRRANWLRP